MVTETTWSQRLKYLLSDVLQESLLTFGLGEEHSKYKDGLAQGLKARSLEACVTGV